MSSTRQDELRRIYGANGRLTAQIVVDTVRGDEANPLYPEFEWNDTVAGEEYRLSQARCLIRTVRILEAPGDVETVRAFHSVVRHDGQSYEPIEVIRDNEFLRAQLLRTMEREWRTLYARYHSTKEFMDLVRADLASV